MLDRPRLHHHAQIERDQVRLVSLLRVILSALAGVIQVERVCGSGGSGNGFGLSSGRGESGRSRLSKIVLGRKGIMSDARNPVLIFSFVNSFSSCFCQEIWEIVVCNCSSLQVIHFFAVEVLK